MRGFVAAAAAAAAAGIGGGWRGGSKARNEGLAKYGNGYSGFQDWVLVFLELE